MAKSILAREYECCRGYASKFENRSADCPAYQMPPAAYFRERDCGRSAVMTPRSVVRPSHFKLSPRYTFRGRRLAMSVIVLLASVACSRSTPEVYTQPAGAVDGNPILTFGDPAADDPPSLNDEPSTALDVQAFADEMIGARVHDFVVHRVVHPRSGGGIDYFYGPGQAGPGPGTCQARVYRVLSGDPTPAARPALRGEWSDNVYSVAGSVAPLPEPSPSGYRERLDAACKARRDMAAWFYSKPGTAYIGARLADLVVATARRAGALPFELECTPFPPDVAESPACAADVRRTVASMDPRAIMMVEDCLGHPLEPGCLKIVLAQMPARGSSAEEYQWSLEVRHRDDGRLRIEAVDVGDHYVTFD